jgi:hypothetical protein
VDFRGTKGFALKNTADLRLVGFYAVFRPCKHSDSMIARGIRTTWPDAPSFLCYCNAASFNYFAGASTKS